MKKILSIILSLALLVTTLFGMGITAKAELVIDAGDEAIYKVGNSYMDKDGYYLLAVGGYDKYTASSSIYNKIEHIEWTIDHTNVLGFYGSKSDYDNAYSCIVVGKQAGYAKLDGRVLSSYSGPNYSYDAKWCDNIYRIHVVEPLSKVTPVDPVSTMQIGQTKELDFSFDSIYSVFFSLPFSYTTSDSSVVSVDEKGVVTALGYGSADINIVSCDGKVLTTYTVNIPSPNTPVQSGSTNGNTTASNNGSSAEAASSGVSAKPKATSIKKLSRGKKKFEATWKKVNGVSGYQLQYSTNSKFKKDKKTITINKAKTISKTVKGLKPKKKYYVRMRTYKIVNGKKVYSSWSKAKSVKTK